MPSKNGKPNTTNKGNKNFKSPKAKPKPKTKLNEDKELIIKLKEKIMNLEKHNMNLESENQRNLIEFKKVAEGFQEKAQQKVAEKNKENIEKLEKEKDEIKKYGTQKLLESIIDPILNIEQAVQAGKNNEAVSAYVMGFEMLLNQLYNELESFGVVTISPNPGDEFDPEVHYIMSQIDGGTTNTISEVKKKGFKLHDRVLKPATVITFK